MKRVEDLNLPIEYHPTMDVFDASKTQAFMDCPRKYFFSYVLGWQPKRPNIHLVFGSGWHEAMEHFMLNGLSEDQVILAYDKFLEGYKKDHPIEILDELSRQKSSHTALHALNEYAKAFRHRDDFEVIYTELAFAVPIAGGKVMFGKMDSVVRESNGAIRSYEHKTTGRKTSAWMDSWISKFQVGLYNHALNVEFGDKAKGLVINGAVLKKEPEFIRVPCKLNNQQMSQWEFEAQFWTNLIMWNFERLAEATEDDHVLQAFPRNTESCGKFGCPHPELCNLRANPLRDVDNIPLGYKKEFWDPRRIEGAKFELDLTKDKDAYNPSDNSD